MDQIVAPELDVEAFTFMYNVLTHKLGKNTPKGLHYDLMCVLMSDHGKNITAAFAAKRAADEAYLESKRGEFRSRL